MAGNRPVNFTISGHSSSLKTFRRITINLWLNSKLNVKIQKRRLVWGRRINVNLSSNSSVVHWIALFEVSDHKSLTNRAQFWEKMRTLGKWSAPKVHNTSMFAPRRFDVSLLTLIRVWNIISVIFSAFCRGSSGILLSTFSFCILFFQFSSWTIGATLSREPTQSHYGSGWMHVLLPNHTKFSTSLRLGCKHSHIRTISRTDLPHRPRAKYHRCRGQ